MQAARARVVAAVAVVAVVVLCVAFGIRSRERTDGRGGPSTASRTPEGQPTGPRGSSGGLTESRRTPAPVGTGMAVTRLAFGSQDNGYALLARCEQGEIGKRKCASALVATLDGGLSWIERPLPEHQDAELILVVHDEHTLGLGAADQAWYVSLNQGRSWERRPFGPVPYELRPAEFGVLCPNPLAPHGCEGPLVEYRPEGLRRFNSEPPLPRLAYDATLAGTTLWAVTADAGKVYAAMSVDRGHTWQRRDPPAPTSVVVEPRLSASLDGKDVWISGKQANETTALWRYDAAAGAWSLAAPTTPPPRLFDVIALSEHRLAALTYGGFGYVLDDGAQWARARQALFGRFIALSQLPDGTFQAYAENGDVWLGVGSGTDRHWIDVTVVPPRA